MATSMRGLRVGMRENHNPAGSHRAAPMAESARTMQQAPKPNWGPAASLKLIASATTRQTSE